jgi:hypothetical protein
MKALPILLSAVLVGSLPVARASAQTADQSWYAYSDLTFTCTNKNKSGCDAHPSNSFSPIGTHRENFIPGVPASEKDKYTYTQVLDPGKEQCGQVGWSTNHMGWVPQGNAQVLTKWKENHSGVSCKVVGKKVKEVVKPVWMLLYSRDGKPYAAGLYADEAGRPMTSAGNQSFTNTNSAPWMGHAVCENAQKFYGEGSIGPAGRMVNGQGFVTLSSTGEQVPATSFMVSYVKDSYFGGFKKSEWRPPVCEVLRADLRYAPKYQEKYAHVEVKTETQSGSNLVRVDY